MRQPVFLASLQQQAHPDPAAGGRPQRTPEAQPWHKIGTSDQNVVAGVPNRPQIGALNRVPQPQIVA